MRLRRAAHARWTGVLLLGCAMLIATPFSAPAQSLLERTPNLAGGWIGAPGVLHFHFLHRFDASPAPERKVSNVPTFELATALPLDLLVGLRYSTNSTLAPRYPNEWEIYARRRFLSERSGSPVDATAQIGYNLAAEGVDGELSIARRSGAFRVMAAGRLLSESWNDAGMRGALAAGATLRLGPHLAVAADAATLLDPAEGEQVAWGVGLHLALPQTPHTLSLQATNTGAGTQQGISRGGEQIRYGFEFTIPVTLRRWLGGAAMPSAGGELPLVPLTDGVARAEIRGMVYVPARIEVVAGTTVEWRNEDPVAHTVTAEDGSFDSGLIQPGGVWRHTFVTPGAFPFACVPHPFMNGVVVVREAP